MNANEKLVDDITKKIDDTVNTLASEIPVSQIDLKMLQADKTSLEELKDDARWGIIATNLISKINYILEYKVPD